MTGPPGLLGKVILEKTVGWSEERFVIEHLYVPCISAVTSVSNMEESLHTFRVVKLA